MAGCIYGLLWWCSQRGFWYFFPIRNQANSFLGCFWNFSNQIISRRRADRMEKMKWSFPSCFSEKFGEGEQSEASRGSGIAVVRRCMGSSSVHCLLLCFSHTSVARVASWILDAAADFFFLAAVNCYILSLLPAVSSHLLPGTGPGAWQTLCWEVHLGNLPEAGLLYLGSWFSAGSAEHHSCGKEDKNWGTWERGPAPFGTSDPLEWLTLYICHLY